MSEEKQQPEHFIKREPKFCRCRVCHEHFYGETIKEASQTSREHGNKEHPGYGDSTHE